MMAIQGGYLDVVNKLLDKKEIDVNDGDSGEQLDIVEMLLGKNEIDVNVQNARGNTALMMAREFRGERGRKIQSRITNRSRFQIAHESPHQFIFYKQKNK